MKKDKLYLIISILFVLVISLVVKGFNVTYSAPTGDLGGSGNLYWAIDGDSCDTENAGCTLKISNNSIDGEHYVYGKVNGDTQYSGSNIPWYAYKNGITNITIGDEEDIVKPKYVNYWFYNLKYLSNGEMIYLDTTEVTDMSYMFYNAGYNATSFELDLTGWNTSNVTSMESMFHMVGYNSKTWIIKGIDGFNTSQVNNMRYMFFRAAYVAESIEMDLSSWDTSQVNNFDYTFGSLGYNSINLSLILSNWDVTKASNIYKIFDGQESNPGLGLNAKTFYLNVSKWNTSNVKNMAYLFRGAGYWSDDWSIEGLNDWDTSKVTSMTGMFDYSGYKAKKIDLDLSKWNTSNVTGMSRMFSLMGGYANDFNLNLNGWDTSNVEYMSSMFYFTGHYSGVAVSLDLSSWDTTSVVDSNYMFRYTDSLFSIKVGDKWTLPLTNFTWINKDTGESYSNGNIPQNTAATYNRNVFFWAVDGEGCVSGNDDCVLKISNNYINGSHTYSSAFEKSNSTVNWSKYSGKITSVDIGGENDIISTVSTRSWFAGFKKITSFDFTYLNISNIENMSYMFSGCTNVEKFDFSDWDTSNVYSNDGMFNNTSDNIEIKVGDKWTLNLSEQIWRNKDTLAFYENGKIPKNVAGTYIKYNDEMYWAVKDDTLIISNNPIDGNVDQGSFTNEANWFKYTNIIKKVQVGAEDDIIYPPAMKDWFNGLYKVKKIDLTYLDTRYTTSMQNTFATGYCYFDDSETCLSSLTEIIGLENLDTSNVTNMSGLFAYSYSLKELNLNGWDTSKVEDMSLMFISDTKLEKIKGIENFNVSNVKEYVGMFYNCSSINELDLSGWDTLKSTCTYNFDGNELVLESYNSNISTEDNIVRSKCKIFDNNNSLSNITIGKNFNILLPESEWINADTNVSYINQEIPLKEAATYNKKSAIYWTVDDDTLILSNKNYDGYNSFDTAIYILNQNNWKKYKDDIEKVVIDGVIKPVYMNEWFNGLDKVKTLDLGNIDTTNLLSVHKLVNDMDSLEKVNLINFDTSNISTCISLTKNNNLTLIKRFQNEDFEDYCEHTFFNCTYGGNTNFEIKACVDYKKYCGTDITGCDKAKNDCDDISNSVSCSTYNDKCKSSDFISPYCDYIESDIANGITFELPEYNKYCKDIDRPRYTCLSAMYDYEEYDDEFSKEFLDNYCSNFSVDAKTCNATLEIYVDGYYNAFDIYTKYCKDIPAQYDKYICENILDRCVYDEDSDACEIYANKCSEIGNIDDICMIEKYLFDKWEESFDEEFLDTYCENYEINEKTLNKTLNLCTNGLDDACYAFDTYDTGVSISNDNCLMLRKVLENYYDDTMISIFNNKCSNINYNKNICENILDECVYEEDDIACEMYTNKCSEIGNTGGICMEADYYYDKYGEEFDKVTLETYCEDYTPTFEECERLKSNCDWDEDACEMHDNYCKDIPFVPTEPTTPSTPITCDIFSNNNKLKQISVDENNVDLVKESLSGPDNKTGKWYDRDGNEYAVSEILNEEKTYYSTKPAIVSYNAEVDDQTKFIGEDLTLYDEIIKDSDTSEIITKFDTVGGNDIDDVTSLKITTYTLKDFTDVDGNLYLPGSKYTKDEDLELDVNYNSEDHYNEIELPIPVKHGYKFEYWTLDGERIDKYTPKTNETLKAVWTEIKYHFVDDEVEYEKENIDNVIFETVEGLDNFEELYINGKQLEKDSDYTLDGNKIILTEKGKEYLDSLDAGEYEVRAEFSDSNSDVYGIIKVSESKVIPKEEPETPSTPKTSDYILFTVIIALTALISSIFVYKKMEKA